MNRECRQMPEKQGNSLPARAVLRPDGLYLALRDIGPEELRDAFMQETVVRVPAAESSSTSPGKTSARRRLIPHRPASYFTSHVAGRR